MHQSIAIYKPKGITPYQLIQQFRKTHPQYAQETIGFAGRLDPLAHGVMLFMIGDATKDRDTYLSLSKEYECEAVFGIATDTYDVLGIPQTAVDKRLTINRQALTAFLQSKLGKHIQSYPPFSSKAVHGKPLHWWAKQGKLKKITIPTREIEIYDFQLITTKTISAKKLQKEVKQQISSVTGDFRQKEIGERWEAVFAKSKKLRVQSYPTARFYISCSSGTYVRALVDELGKYLGCGATTIEILRTRVGKYSLSNAISALKEA